MFRLETICHSGHSEPKDVALGGRSLGVGTLLECSKRGRFFKAPSNQWKLLFEGNWPSFAYTVLYVLYTFIAHEFLGTVPGNIA
jgi:hypothetical protein